MTPDADLAGAAQNIPERIINYLQTQNLGRPVKVEVLQGGSISNTTRIITSSKISLVLKQALNPPTDLFQCEASGLQKLGQHLHTPQVLLVGQDFLLLEDLGTFIEPSDQYWEALGHALALQHIRDTSSLFGLDYANYLGRLPQINCWETDGHEFFSKYRILRYLDEPLCKEALSGQDRLNLEHLASNLKNLIPVQPASLLHGDLWKGNVLKGPSEEPVLIDPAINYGWAEAELAMVKQCGGVPERFFQAYNEVNPLEEGWWERLDVLFVREYLSVIAHFGNKYNTVTKLRAVLHRFGRI